ncbi:MAG: zinc ribbon domain-containing protein [Candidatus Marinimicrobia bacterium]|nr:zinc ribbon domain-containing protein [Candidatus Neomarinimicrobiota bacterium]
MPTYEYLCHNCGYTFEKFQNISEEPVKTCPKCGQNEVHRLISGGSGVIFKGTGFYKTDYANKPKTDETLKTGTKSKTSSEKT